MNKNNTDDENNERMINLFFLVLNFVSYFCFRFELPALMSGTHRATGFYLSGGKIVIII